MRPSLRLIVPALASLVVVAGSAAPAVAAPAAAAAASRVESPTFTRYDASFKAELTLRQRAMYSEKAYYESDAFVRLSGTVPNVRFMNKRFLSGFGRGWVKASGTSGSERVTGETTDEGFPERTDCEGKSIVPDKFGPPSIVPLAGKMTFSAFRSLTSNEKCTDSDLLAPEKRKRKLPAIPVPINVKASQVGAATIKVPVRRTVPVESCPDYAGPGVNTYCVYQIEGTLTLRLVPDIDVFEAPTKASLAEAAARASVVAGCSTACTATLTVRPLKGGGAASAREALRPRQPETVAVSLGKALRRAIVKSGGARLEVTYRSGNQDKTFSQKVRA